MSELSEYPVELPRNWRLRADTCRDGRVEVVDGLAWGRLRQARHSEQRLRETGFR